MSHLPNAIFGHRFSHRSLLFLLIGAALLLSSGCAGSYSAKNSLTLEGHVVVRGHEPFAEAVLTTPNRNLYVLKLSDELARTLITPARYLVTGRVFLSHWNGRPFAHMEVSELELIDEY